MWYEASVLTVQYNKADLIRPMQARIHVSRRLSWYGYEDLNIIEARVYSQTRMDTFWQFREAYDKARQIKEAQDEYCEAALAGKWNLVEGKPFPEELQWEALVDVLRGKVKVRRGTMVKVSI